MKEFINKKLSRNTINISIITIICLLLEFLFLKLWQADFKVPFSYDGGDTSLFISLIKSFSENGWHFFNKYLGAPFGTNLLDFMIIRQECILFIINKILTIITGNLIIAFNLQYLMIIPITSIISYFVMKSLKLNDLISINGSLVYAFLPYVFLRFQAHIVLSCYYFVPISILICIWLLEDNNFFVWKNFWHYKRNLVGVFFAFLIANNGNSYYAPFTVIFIILSAFSISIKTKDKKRFLPGCLISLVICLFVFINLLPCFIYNIIYGHNPEVGIRSPIECEIYGLKITQLLLPTKLSSYLPHHQRLIDYLSSAPLVNENVTSYLGILGIIGFIILLIYIFIKKCDSPLEKRLSLLSELNIFAVLISTIGGLSSIFSIFVSPELRSWNRISVFIAYLCILCVCLIINKYKTPILKILMILVSIISIIEQYPNNTPNYEQSKLMFYNDQKFITQIEENLPHDSMIYQLPYHPFPESGPVNNMSDYNLIIPYIHSKKLKWSYGGMKGRKSDLWNREISILPIDEMLQNICLAGFKGIYIDKRAYTEEEIISLENNLRSILQTQPITSDNQQLLFFNLENYEKELKSKYTEQEIQQKHNEILNIISGGI